MGAVYALAVWWLGGLVVTIIGAAVLYGNLGRRGKRNG